MRPSCRSGSRTIIPARKPWQPARISFQTCFLNILDLKCRSRLVLQARTSSTFRNHVRGQNDLPKGPRSVPSVLSGQARSNILARSKLPVDRLIELIDTELRRMYTVCREEDFIQRNGLTLNNSEQQVLGFIEHSQQQLQRGSRSQDPADGTEFSAALRKAFILTGIPGLQSALAYELQGYVANQSVSSEDLISQTRLLDFRHPWEWFPSARRFKREIHLHIGPTNSGKTYHALKALQNAGSGLYGGPLRLLAHEVATRFIQLGIPCDIVTGDERVMHRDSQGKMVACTVEMLPIEVPVEVAVIDEIQLLSDPERGFAWTQAVLGVCAKKLHLCGEARSLSMVKALAAATGEEVIVHNYERLSPLRTMTSSLKGKLKDLRKGDCVVGFSRALIHGLKHEIEKETGRNVAIIYGTLPPETRAQQARLFNDPENDYDILVASNAIGMGLNLSIKRIIFESVYRFDGVEEVVLTPSEMKQIGGRAGRYRSGNDNTSSTGAGFVTTLHESDLKVVQRAMLDDLDQIKAAYIQAPDHIIARFASYFPSNTPLCYILRRMRELAKPHMPSHLSLITMKPQQMAAELLAGVRGMSLADQLEFLKAPLSLKTPEGERLAMNLATCIAEQQGGDLLQIADLDFGLIRFDGPPSALLLHRLEFLHSSLVLYSWLSYRFPGVFRSRDLAIHVKELVQRKMKDVLEALSANRKYNPQYMREKREALLEEFEGDEKVRTSLKPEGTSEDLLDPQKITAVSQE